VIFGALHAAFEVAVVDGTAGELTLAVAGSDTKEVVVTSKVGMGTAPDAAPRVCTLVGCDEQAPPMTATASTCNATPTAAIVNPTR
jgi:hypothetical protein